MNEKKVKNLLNNLNLCSIVRKSACKITKFNYHIKYENTILILTNNVFYDGKKIHERKINLRIQQYIKEQNQDGKFIKSKL